MGAKEWENNFGEYTMPIIAKDFMIDPLQIAKAVCEGARAVLLIAAVCLPDLNDLLDTCTILGIEALVEVHTPEELNIAAECGAGVFLVNQRNRATGEIITGRAVEMMRYMPPDAQCLVCGGIPRLDQVRPLRRAGYDGFVL